MKSLEYALKILEKYPRNHGNICQKLVPKKIMEELSADHDYTMCKYCPLWDWHSKCGVFDETIRQEVKTIIRKKKLRKLLS